MKQQFKRMSFECIEKLFCLPLLAAGATGERCGALEPWVAS